MQTEDVSSADLRSMLMDVLRDKQAGGGASVRSTIQLRPEVKWPHLDDNDHDIETFYEEFEEIIGLANDGRGMNAVEKLRCLGQCLKRSRHKVYKVVIKESRLCGRLKEDPGAVYDLVRERLMEFKEGLLERQNRVDQEWMALTKGSLSVLQFLPRFEAAVSELELAGLGKADRELLLATSGRLGIHGERRS